MLEAAESGQDVREGRRQEHARRGRVPGGLREPSRFVGRGGVVIRIQIPFCIPWYLVVYRVTDHLVDLSLLRSK